MSDRICLQCGESVHGRADKKFCDDQCRNNYNNRINNANSAEVRNINSILRRNRRILKSMINSSGKTKVSKARLHENGFNFRYHTHTYTTQKGNVFRLCYDCAYLQLLNGQVMVLKWTEGIRS